MKYTAMRPPPPGTFSETESSLQNQRGTHTTKKCSKYLADVIPQAYELYAGVYTLPVVGKPALGTSSGGGVASNHKL